MKTRGKQFFRVLVGVAVLLILLSGGYWGLQVFSSRKVRAFAAKYDQFMKIDFERALVNPFDRTLYLWNVHCDFAVGSSCDADRIVLEEFDFEHSLPFFFKGRVDGAVVPVDFMNFGPYSPVLRKMGYNELSFDLAADYRYEDRTRRLSVNRIVFDGKDLFKISIGFDLGDLKMQNPGLTGLIGVSLLDGGLVFRNRSFFGRAMEYYALQDRVSPEEYRTGLLENIRLRERKAESSGNGYAEKFYAALAGFIEKQGRLVLKLDPAESVPLLYIFMGRNFEELLELYGVTAETVE